MCHTVYPNPDGFGDNIETPIHSHFIHSIKYIKEKRRKPLPVVFLLIELVAGLQALGKPPII